MNDQARKLYDRAQSLDREADALRFKLNSVASPAERVTLQAQIDQVSQRAADAWADWHDAQDAHRRGRSSSTGSPAATTPPPPALSATEVAARRRAASRALWGRVIGKVNAEMFGSQPDGQKTPSTAAPAGNSQKSATKSIWSKAIAAANASIASGEPSTSREGQAPSNGRPQASSEEFLSKSMATAGKQLEQAGFKVM